MNIEVAYFSRPRYLFKVDRSAYFPVPKCDGAMVDFELRPAAARPQLPITDAQFLSLVRPRTVCILTMFRGMATMDLSSINRRDEAGFVEGSDATPIDGRAQCSWSCC